MENVMQAQTYNPVRGRNIPQEMADLARERGCGLTRKELNGEGYTDDQIDRHAAAAARLFANQSQRQAA